MSCRKDKGPKYINRKSPPIPANNCKIGTVKKGNDGNKYYIGEVKSKTGTYYKWLKCKGKCDIKISKVKNNKKCKLGEVLKKGYTRKGYITKTGKQTKDIVIKSKCIKKKSKSKTKSKAETKAETKAKSKAKAKAKAKAKSKSKSKVKVKVVHKFIPTKKNKGIGKLKSGELGKHGYKHIKTLSLSNRHNSLTNAVNDYGAHTVFRKLGALRTYQKHKNPLVSKLCHNNQKWIRKQFNHQFKGSWKNSKVFNK